MRVVLDTNVLISAYVFPGGSPEAVYRLVLDNRIELATSRPLLLEFAKVLQTKFGWAPSRSEAAVSQVARVASIVEPKTRLRVITADPADNRVLEAAIEARADYIVSGDKHLLDVRDFREIRVLPPAELLKLTSAKG